MKPFIRDVKNRRHHYPIATYTLIKLRSFRQRVRNDWRKIPIKRLRFIVYERIEGGVHPVFAGIQFDDLPLPSPPPQDMRTGSENGS